MIKLRLSSEQETWTTYSGADDVARGDIVIFADDADSGRVVLGIVIEYPRANGAVEIELFAMPLVDLFNPDADDMPYIVEVHFTKLGIVRCADATTGGPANA